MKILIFGGSGFLGSHTCIELLRNGHHLDLVIRTPVSQKSLLMTYLMHFKFINWNEWRGLDFSNYDCVLVMIGGVSSRVSDVEIEEANYTLPLDLFNKAKVSRLKHFVFISSVATRSGGSDIYNEESNFHARPTLYAQAKMRIEKKIKEYAGPMLITIISPGFLVGEGDVNITSSMVFLQVRLGRLKAYPEGAKTISHPSDVARAIVTAIENRIDGLFLLGGFHIKYEDFFSIVISKMEVSSQLKLDPFWKPTSSFEREFFDFSMVDDSKARSELDYKPKVKVEEMIEWAIKSLKENKRI